LFLSSPMYTCRANSAKTIRQKMVSVITSANCLNECSSALMMVFRPVGTHRNHPVDRLTRTHRNHPVDRLTGTHRNHPVDTD
jgi:hypothetical protein